MSLALMIPFLICFNNVIRHMPTRASVLDFLQPYAVLKHIRFIIWSHYVSLILIRIIHIKRTVSPHFAFVSVIFHIKFSLTIDVFNCFCSHLLLDKNTIGINHIILQTLYYLCSLMRIYSYSHSRKSYRPSVPNYELQHNMLSTFIQINCNSS